MLDKIKGWLSIFTGIAGTIGILYGVFTYLDTRGHRIADSVTEKEMLEIVDKIHADIRDLNTSYEYLIDATTKINERLDQVFENTDVLKREMIKHIRKEPFPEAEKIEDILRLLEGMSKENDDSSESLRQDTIKPKIVVRKINK